MAKKTMKKKIASSRRKIGLLLSVKTGAYGAGGGAVGQVAGEFLRDKSEWVAKKWYGEPAALFGASLLVQRVPKGRDVAIGMAGGAGFCAAFYYKLDQFQKGKRKKSPVPVFEGAAAAATPETEGYPGDPTSSEVSHYDTAPEEPFDEPVAEDTGLMLEDFEDEEDTGAMQGAPDEEYDISSALNLGGGMGNPIGY